METRPDMLYTALYELTDSLNDYLNAFYEAPEDIPEGILRITVLVAVSRPAEFIGITFQQQMQKS